VSAEVISDLFGISRQTFASWNARKLAKRIAAEPQKFRAATLGERVRLTFVKRCRLGIKSFRAIDQPPPKERKRQLDRERRQRQRAEARAVGETQPKP
jgi:hypothetical protein